jgi:cullin-associated NEDD8-dissociated protein 1
MEPEMEPEPEPEGPLLAPEFQIFTPPFFVGYLNGMTSLINSGVSYDCGQGENLGMNIHWTVSNGHWRKMCPQGSLAWQGPGSASEVVDELDVLMTGGRLSSRSHGTVLQAYLDAPPGQGLQAAQQAMIMTAEFNTLGDPLVKPFLRPPKQITEPPPSKGYKAVVMVFLAGGADTFNLLVPQDCDVYQQYRTIRTDLLLEPRELIKFSTTGQACSNFGVHGALGS